MGLYMVSFVVVKNAANSAILKNESGSSLQKRVIDELAAFP